MHFRFVVEIDVERSEGKFMPRDELAGQIQDALENADPSSYTGDNGGQYEGQAWDVHEEDELDPRIGSLLRDIAAAQGVDPDRCKRWTRTAKSILGVKRIKAKAVNNDDGGA